MVVSIEIVPLRAGSERAKRALRKLQRKIKDPRPANRNVSIWLLRWVNENFKSEGGKVGRWKPFKLGGRKLPDGTIDTKAKLLQDTGRLRASFQNFYSKDVAGVGSPLDYSLAHELGLPSKNLPARRMIPNASDKDVEAAVIRIYDAYIRRAMS